MDIIQAIWQAISAHWVEIAAGAWLVEQGLRILSKITPWKWDDNLVDVIEKILQSIFPKKSA